MYYFVPKMIRFYMGEEPILPNVPTYLTMFEETGNTCSSTFPSWLSRAPMRAAATACSSGLTPLLKSTRSSGRPIIADPRNYVAQPVVQLSRSPSYCEGAIQGRHVDLRPYILYGEKITIIPGGLTRVALRKGSLIVNSSQGGGSKDSWVIDDE
jgi:uncharacterized circularly permuted ATP-grasp superfamily protein